MDSAVKPQNDPILMFYTNVGVICNFKIYFLFH
jgi:hypothetical protein